MISKTKKALDRKFYLARVWSNQELKKNAIYFTGDILNVSGANDDDKEGGKYADYFINRTSYTITNFSGDKGYKKRENEIFLDITSNLPEELIGRYDVVFNHTMLEHVYDVFTAFKNLCMLTKDVLIIVVPFAQYQHAMNKSYGDYWRFCPQIMRRLFHDNGMEVVYESETPYKHAGVYLFYVGVKHPQKWKSKIPAYEPIKRAGAWIGEVPTKMGIINKILDRF